MGLFDFIRGIGKKISGADDTDDPLADQKKTIALTTELKKLGLPVEGLKVAYADGLATLHGHVPSAEVAHKLIVALGNFEAVGQVDSKLTIAPPPKAVSAPEAEPEPAEEPPAPLLHTVQKGESLSLIAKHYYGAIHLYPAIFEANQPMIADVDEIFPGQVLTIPRDPTPLVHTVKKGETLGKIARFHYGDPKLYTTIFEANQGTLSDPNKIEIGQELTIPLLRKPEA